MAVRKETIKQQFNEALPAVLEPGERVLGGTYGVSGPNPLWAQGLLGLAGFLLFGMRYFYVALTDRRLIFMNASFWTSRPQGFCAVRPAGLDHDQRPANRQQAVELRQDLEPDQTEPPHELPRVLASRAQGGGQSARRPDCRLAIGPGSRGRSGPVPRLHRLRRADRSARDALLPWRGSGGVAQSGRALPSHGRGQGFESPHLHFQRLIRTGAREERREDLRELRSTDAPVLDVDGLELFAKDARTSSRPRYSRASELFPAACHTTFTWRCSFSHSMSPATNALYPRYGRARCLPRRPWRPPSQQRIEPSENADARPADGCRSRQGYRNQRPMCLPKRNAVL